MGHRHSTFGTGCQLTQIWETNHLSRTVSGEKLGELVTQPIEVR